MNDTRCPVPGCAWSTPWALDDLPAINPYITDGDTAVREAAGRAAQADADRIEALLLAHGEQAHDTAEFVEAVLAQQNGP